MKDSRVVREAGPPWCLPVTYVHPIKSVKVRPRVKKALAPAAPRGDERQAGGGVMRLTSSVRAEVKLLHNPKRPDLSNAKVTLLSDRTTAGVPLPTLLKESFRHC